MPVRTFLAAITIAAVVATGCSGGSTPRTAAAPSVSATATSPLPPSSPCPSPSGLHQGDRFCVAGVQAPARFWEQADVRGKTALDIVIGRVVEGQPYFSPTVLTASPGQQLEVTVTNTVMGGDAHTFTIDEESIDETLESGDSTTVTVTVPASGTLTFYCKYHWTFGQSGEFIVTQ